MRILLIGATGFLGSHIAEILCSSGYELLLTKRTASNLWRCASFEEQVKWTNTDLETFESEVLAFQPTVIINSAWNGVSARERDSWNEQLSNLLYQQRLLDLAKQLSVKVFIGIGSQAEYGTFDGCIDENYPANPNSAYGAVKLAAQKIVKAFCDTNSITWYWLRVFSIYGERESTHWLVPSVIVRMLGEETSMNFTKGEQSYSYMYVKDFARAVEAVCKKKNGVSGVYNLSSLNSLTIRELLEKIRNQINPSFSLNFGALPYRAGQSMKILSDSTKFVEEFGEFEQTNFSEGLTKVINYYRNNYEAI